jgi:hypothetical protein
MEPQYFDNDNIAKPIYKISSLANRVLPTIKVKKRGGLNHITDLREQTAKLLNVPKEQVMGITKGWSKEELYKTYHSAEQFINPPALWWTIYKQKKHIYGKQTNAKMGSKGRISNKKENAQRPLF